MMYLSQRPDGVICQAAQSLVSAVLTIPGARCAHLGSQRRCCPGLYICRRHKSACIPAADGPASPPAGVTLCRDCTAFLPVAPIAVATVTTAECGDNERPRS